MATQDSMAVLLQEAISELQESRKQTSALLKQNQKLAEQNAKLAQTVKDAVDSSSAKQKKPKTHVSTYTKNLIHSIYRSSSSADDAENCHEWNLTERFDSAANKLVTRELIREVKNDASDITEEEIHCGCQVYFKSLCDDSKRKQSGAFDRHQKQQKRVGRLKQKLKIRNLGFDDASNSNNWSTLHKQRIKMLLSVDYMSSESSDEEPISTDSTLTRPVLKVKKLMWLKKKYRDSFHQIDSTYYQSHKRSRDKLKCRVQGNNSTRLQPPHPPKFAIKSEFRIEADQDLLNSSLSSEASGSNDAE